MSVSSPEVSLSSSSTTSSSCTKDDVDYWEVNPPPTPASLSRLNSMDCWDYSIELDCLKGPEDLQLAAELGKTLLERNKELEGTIKHQQTIIDDQLQEIEYLTKQNNALREVNDTRLKIYENIEISIQDLEKQNHRLNVDNSNLKKINKNSITTNESLEEKCEDLRKQIEDLNREVEIERRKNERLQVEQRTNKDEMAIVIAAATAAASTPTTPSNLRCSTNTNSNTDTTSIKNGSVQRIHELSSTIAVNDCEAMGIDEVDRRLAVETCDNDEIINIITELDGTKRQLNAERQRVTELEDQLSSLIQDNRELQNRIAQSAVSDISEMRSMHDELAILEESGQGKLCRRCLRCFDDDTLTVPDYASSIACTDDGDDASLNELLLQRTNSVQNMMYDSAAAAAAAAAATPLPPTANQPDELNAADSTLNLSAPSPNPYRDLVDKYEALLEVHNAEFNRARQDDITPANSLHDELTNATANKDTNENEQQQFTNQNRKLMQASAATAAVVAAAAAAAAAADASGAKRKVNLQTPTDFSEAETSSSGFSDEISNKCTQTEETFLCTIADGEDKFSIYDEASPIDSRFRHCPKYRHLFKEIFATLKKAAEHKDDGEKLPLLDDSTNPAFKVPPVTPAAEELPSFPEVETESVISSSAMSEQSVAMSECVTKHERKTAKKKTGQENKVAGDGGAASGSKKEQFENVRSLMSHKRGEPLEYLAFSNLRKKNKKRNRQNSVATIDPSDSPALIPTSPRFFYANRKRRERIAYDFPKTTATANEQTKAGNDQANATNSGTASDVIWNGNSITVYNRAMQSRACGKTAGEGGETIVYRSKSAAAHDLHKLIKLDLSYAEVLRRADQTGKSRNRRK